MPALHVLLPISHPTVPSVCSPNMQPHSAGMDSCGFVPVSSLVRSMETAPTPDQVLHVAQTDDKVSWV